MIQFRELNEESRRQRPPRAHLVVERGSGPLVRVAGRAAPCVSFCSNDYLGLARHADVVAALQQAAAAFGVGAGSSRLLAGHHGEHRALEEELADFLGVEAALSFTSGFAGTTGVLDALVDAAGGPGAARFFVDQLGHASARYALDRRGVAAVSYRHGDPRDLETHLARGGDSPQHQVIVTDGVFSADGLIAPVAQLAALARAHSALLVVDDAHGIGTVGAGGRGALAASGVAPGAIGLLLGTCSKALGTCGGFVGGSRDAIDYLRQTTRSHAYSTALPACLARATRKSLAVLRAEPWRHAALVRICEHFSRAARQAGLSTGASETAIRTVQVAAGDSAADLATRLLDDGIFLCAPLDPAAAALRITLTIEHEPAHVDRLIDALTRRAAR